MRSQRGWKEPLSACERAKTEAARVVREEAVRAFIEIMACKATPPSTGAEK